MSGFEIGSLSILLIMAFVYLGMYVPVVLMLVSFTGTWLITQTFDISISLLAIKSAETVASQEFAVIPLFVLMGLLVSGSNIAKETFDVANHYLKRVPGGLGIATVASNAVFAAITGVTIASAAVFSRVAVPEMLRHGYDRRYAVGVVAGSSVLGMLIPPSILLIVYAFIAEQSVGALFLAAIVPGLLLTGCYCVGILVFARLRPEIAAARPGSNVADSGGEPINARTTVKYLLPIATLITVVIGGIYGGFFTPTEAGAIGATGALILTILKRQWSVKSFWSLTAETGHITASICLLIIAAGMYSAMLGLSGIPDELESIVVGANLSKWQVILLYLLIILVLGTIMDSISIMLIVVPVFLPLLNAFGLDLIWFGIVTIMSVEIGLLTPPLGMAVYVIKSTLGNDDITLKDIFVGAAPFAIIMLLTTMLVILFPGLTEVFR